MPLHSDFSGAIATLELAHPPVNALALDLRRALLEAIERADADASIRAIVLSGSGKGFCAGGDRTEFGTPAADARPTLSRDVLSRIEACGKPVVAAIHGFAVGGGLELALACHARVAVASARIGLPEVGIGTLPLSATQRLPRVLGLQAAAQMILEAELVDVETLRHTRLFDAIVADGAALRPAAVACALAAADRPLRPVSHWPWPDADPPQALQHLLATRQPDADTPAVRVALAALAAAVQAPDFQAGLDRAQALFDELGGSRRPYRPGAAVD